MTGRVVIKLLGQFTHKYRGAEFTARACGYFQVFVHKTGRKARIKCIVQDKGGELKLAGSAAPVST